MTINNTNWTVTDTKLTDKNSCLSLEIKTSTGEAKSIEVSVDTTKTTTICKKIQDVGLITTSYELY